MLTKYLSLLEHTIRWHFPASFETGYGITRLQSMEYGWIYTHHFQVSQRIEVKDSGPSGHGQTVFYLQLFTSSSSKGLTWLYPWPQDFPTSYEVDSLPS